MTTTRNEERRKNNWTIEESGLACETMPGMQSILKDQMAEWLTTRMSNEINTENSVTGKVGR